MQSRVKAAQCSFSPCCFLLFFHFFFELLTNTETFSLPSTVCATLYTCITFFYHMYMCIRVVFVGKNPTVRSHRGSLLCFFFFFFFFSLVVPFHSIISQMRENVHPRSCDDVGGNTYTYIYLYFYTSLLLLHQPTYLSTYLPTNSFFFFFSAIFFFFCRCFLHTFWIILQPGLKTFGLWYSKTLTISLLRQINFYILFYFSVYKWKKKNHVPYFIFFLSHSILRSRPCKSIFIYGKTCFFFGWII